MRLGKLPILPAGDAPKRDRFRNGRQGGGPAGFGGRGGPCLQVCHNSSTPRSPTHFACRKVIPNRRLRRGAVFARQMHYQSNKFGTIPTAKLCVPLR